MFEIKVVNAKCCLTCKYYKKLYCKQLKKDTNPHKVCGKHRWQPRFSPKVVKRGKIYKDNTGPKYIDDILREKGILHERKG